jgi:AAA15 family ATPase/GTPase
MEITKFGLKNFRIFKEHYDFELAPIMLLTGPNNSGKSSLTKALLLMKENGEDITDAWLLARTLNYYKGSHDLGSHKLILSTEEENTIFSFSTFNNYKFQIEIDYNRVYEWDYIIANDKNEIVISQKLERIYIDVGNFYTYLIHWAVNYGKTKDYIPKNYKIDAYKFSDLFENFTEYVTKNKIGIVDVRMLDHDLFSEEEINANLKKGIVANFSYDFNTEIDPAALGFQEMLILLLKKITNVELTKEEMTVLIPPSDLYNSNSNFFQFPKLIYVNSLKEPLKRSYSVNDSSVFQSFIANEMNFIKPDIFNAPKNKFFIDEKSGYDNDIKNRDVFVDFINKWLAEFEIGKKLSYGYNEDNDTFFIKIDNRSLPDYGFGYSSILHILLALSNEAIEQNEEFTKHTEIENFKLTFPPTYIIEEPETGLHPAFQSKIAEMLVDIQKTFKVNLIVETHSEYLIRKLQFLTATEKLKPGEAIIYYFNNPKKIPEGEEQIKKITIEKDGSLTDNFGPGFIDEGTNLKFELLRLNQNQNN